MTGQLAAFARFCALRNFDLQIVRVYQVVRGHTEASGSHLLDGAAAQISVGVWYIASLVLAALTGIGFSTDAIHGDGESLMRFLADGAEGHGARGKALYNFGGGFD